MEKPLLVPATRPVAWSEQTACGERETVCLRLSGHLHHVSEGGNRSVMVRYPGREVRVGVGEGGREGDNWGVGVGGRAKGRRVVGSWSKV